MSPTAIWLLLSALCLVAEIFTITFLLFFPGIAAFLTFLLSLFVDSVAIQITVFVITSIIMIVFIRPLVAKLFKTKDVATNSNSLIGKTGTVLKDIEGTEKIGQVKVSGEVWSAICADNTKIDKDSKIIVEAIEGVKLIVKGYTE